MRQREFGVDKKFKAVWKEFSYTAFRAVFSYNIIAKDKGIKPRSLAKLASKAPKTTRNRRTVKRKIQDQSKA